MKELPQAGFVPKYGPKLTALGRLGRLASSGEEDAVATINAELGFLALLFVRRLSQRAGFGDRERERNGSFQTVQG